MDFPRTIKFEKTVDPSRKHFQIGIDENLFKNPMCAVVAALLQIKCCVCLKKNLRFACTLYYLTKSNSFHACNREEVSFLAAEKQQPPQRCLTRKTEQNCKLRFLRYSLPEAGRAV